MAFKAGEKQIIKDSINAFGEELQYRLLAEECMELGKEALKFNRTIGDLEHLAEEIADTEIMIEKMKIMKGRELEVLIANHRIIKLISILDLTEKEGNKYE